MERAPAESKRWEPAATQNKGSKNHRDVKWPKGGKTQKQCEVLFLCRTVETRCATRLTIHRKRSSTLVWCSVGVSVIKWEVLVLEPGAGSAPSCAVCLYNLFTSWMFVVTVMLQQTCLSNLREASSSSEDRSASHGSNMKWVLQREVYSRSEMNLSVDCVHSA